jgi:hypothetical protein
MFQPCRFELVKIKYYGSFPTLEGTGFSSETELRDTVQTGLEFWKIYELFMEHVVRVSNGQLF